MKSLANTLGLVSGRRTKWFVLAGWLLVFFVAGPVAGKLADVQSNDSNTWIPSSAESTQVLKLQEQYGAADTTPAILLYENPNGVTAADRAAVSNQRQQLADITDVTNVSQPISARDGKALQVVVAIHAGNGDSTVIDDAVEKIRGVTDGSNATPKVYVTGPAGLRADTDSALMGLDEKLLAATALVVIALLLLTYRSPFLWILPIIATMFSLVVSQAVVYALSGPLDLMVSAQTGGILTVLVFGAATDYALLLISRYREELRVEQDRHIAMRRALRRSIAPITASAATVAVAMLCLTVADMSSTAGLGPIAAIGMVVGLVVTLTLLPALLVVTGRWIFWPKKPSFGAPAPTHKRWDGLGQLISRRPKAAWAGTAVLLAILAGGLTQLDTKGLATENWFTTKPQSIQGQEAIGRHFPSGEGQPLVVLSQKGTGESVADALRSVPNVADAAPSSALGPKDQTLVTLKVAADSSAGRDAIAAVRTSAHAVPSADALVGGSPALTYDTHKANESDNRHVIPLVLIAVLLVLVVLLRSILAPILVMATVVLSFAAALGFTTILFEGLFGFSGVNSDHPLLVFVFLVALGVDYNIFLMHRVRQEARAHGTAQAARIALSTTGGVITSAGLVLAATFAVFGSMQLVNMVQLGLTVSFGVLLDTFVVRSVLVPALCVQLGDRIWWPAKDVHRDSRGHSESVDDRPDESVREPALV